MMNKHLRLALVAAFCTTGAVAFAPPTVTRQSSTALNLGIPKFFLPKEEQEDSSSASPAKEEKKLDAKGLLQLITAGAGVSKMRVH